jgi:hypothetical protein
MPISEKAFDALARKIATLNTISETTAQAYLAQIGDTPELAPDSDLVIVRDDNGAEIARIKFPSNVS